MKWKIETHRMAAVLKSCPWRAPPPTLVHGHSPPLQTWLSFLVRLFLLLLVPEEMYQQHRGNSPGMDVRGLANSNADVGGVCERNGG